MSRAEHSRDRAARWQARRAPLSAPAAAAPAPAGAGQGQDLVRAFQAVGHAARAMRDPVLGAFARDTTTYTQAGSLTGLTPQILGGYLSEYYDGAYANIAKVWEVMERRDDACQPAREKRVRKVLRKLGDWRIERADDSAEAERQAEFLEGFYNRLAAEHALYPVVRGGLRLGVEYALDAVGKQYAFLAKSWSGRGDGLSLTLRFVPLWFFRQEYGEFHFDPLSGGLSGQPIVQDQWLIASRRLAVMEAASVAVLLKRMPLHQLVHILEKWGNPHVYGHTSAEKGSPSWDLLLEALQAIVSGWTGAISGDAEILTLEPKSGGAGAALGHLPAIDRFDRVITTLFLGSHLGTKAEGDTGNLAGGAQADDTDDVIADDCEWVTELLQEQVDRDALWYGLGVDEPLAWFDATVTQEQDDAGDMDRLAKAIDLGVDDIPVRYVHERFGFPSAKGKEPVLARAAAPAFPGFGPAPGDRTDGTGTDKPADHAGACGCAAVRHAGALAPAPATRAQADLDELAAAALPEAGKALAVLVQPLLDTAAGAADLAQIGAAAAAYAAPAAAREELAEIAARTVFAAVARGRVPDPRGGPARHAASAAEARYAPLPFEEAREFWRKKVSIADYDQWAEATWAQARVYGFKVAGLAESALLDQVKGELARAIAGGLTVDQFVREARDQFGLGAKHAETVVRTNVQTAYAWGHYKQMTDPAVLDAAPIWAFDVVADDRTSDICRPLRGKAYRADHPIWDSLYPPNHYNCRTTVVALSEEDARAQGFAIQDAWPRGETGAEVMPHKDFSMNVGRVPELGDILPDPAESAGNSNPYHDEHGRFSSADGAGGGSGPTGGGGSGEGGGSSGGDGREFASVDKARQQFDRDRQELLSPKHRAPPVITPDAARTRLSDGIEETDSDGHKVGFPADIEKHWLRYGKPEVDRRLSHLNYAVQTVRTGKRYGIKGGKSYYVGSFREGGKGGMLAKAAVLISRRGTVETYWTQRADFVERTDIRHALGEARQDSHPSPDPRTDCAGGGIGAGYGPLQPARAVSARNADTDEDTIDDGFLQQLLAWLAEGLQPMTEREEPRTDERQG